MRQQPDDAEGLNAGAAPSADQRDDGADTVSQPLATTA